MARSRRRAGNSKIAIAIFFLPGRTKSRFLAMRWLSHIVLTLGLFLTGFAAGRLTRLGTTPPGDQLPAGKAPVQLVSLSSNVDKPEARNEGADRLKQIASV